MKKYAVALYSNFDSDVQMDIVYAKSELEAGKQFLLSQGDNTVGNMLHIKTFEDLKRFVFDQDHAIGVLAVNETDWKRFSNANSAEMPISIQ
jgi:5,10-methylenetetrahydrofolate reductase